MLEMGSISLATNFPSLLIGSTRIDLSRSQAADIFYRGPNRNSPDAPDPKSPDPEEAELLYCCTISSVGSLPGSRHTSRRQGLDRA